MEQHLATKVTTTNILSFACSSLSFLIHFPPSNIFGVGCQCISLLSVDTVPTKLILLFSKILLINLQLCIKMCDVTIHLWAKCIYCSWVQAFWTQSLAVMSVLFCLIHFQTFCLFPLEFLYQLALFLFQLYLYPQGSESPA